MEPKELIKRLANFLGRYEIAPKNNRMPDSTHKRGYLCKPCPMKWIVLHTLSLLLNGKRPWRGNLKERYEELVNTFVNTHEGRREIEEEINPEFISEKKVGGAAGTRTLYLFNAIEALSQMSYSPT